MNTEYDPLDWVNTDGFREVHEELALARSIPGEQERHLWNALRNLTNVTTALYEALLNAQQRSWKYDPRQLEFTALAVPSGLTINADVRPNR